MHDMQGFVHFEI